MTDTLASAAADEAIGEALQPDMPTRVAAVEQQLRVIQDGHIQLADLIRRLAESQTDSLGRVLSAEANIVTLAEVTRTAGDLVQQLVDDRIEHVAKIGSVERRLDVVERRSKVRLMPGKS